MDWRRAWIASAALMAFAAPPAGAQLSLKGGVIHGNVKATGAVPEDLGARTGFTLGLSMTSGFSLMGLGVDVLYAQRGAEGEGATGYWKLDYVDVPAYVIATLPTPGVAPYLYAGPQVSFEVRCRVGVAECPGESRAKTTYAGVIGGGVRLGSSKAVSLEGRYVYGVKDLRLETVTVGSNYRHRSFMILAGLHF